jgi:hypothetical protein
MSLLAGVYVKLKGCMAVEDGTRLPLPSAFKLTRVALPPKVLPLNVKGILPHVVPEELMSLIVGALIHCPSAPTELRKKRPAKR